ALITYLILFSVSSFAQKKTSVWYFGNNAGLDFKSGTAVAITDGALSTREGCATICDDLGNILFYTEGTKVWNKNHQIMENGNGLLGDFSSTQSAIIIPKPGTSNIYYIITVPSIYNAGNAILRYSIVDLSYNSGFGKITMKNEIILENVTEKLTAIKKINGIDYWFIAHTRGSDNFYTYSVTESGIDINNPIISEVGIIHSEPISNYVGYLKASPKGNYIACALHGSAQLFELLNFDIQTGAISNPIDFIGHYGAYSLEFSPDETRLYFARENGQNEIFQVNLDLETPIDIINSQTIIGYSPGYNIGALQLGPDDKIYISFDFSQYLGVINEPNNLDTNCDFVQDGVYLAGRQARLGLPNFVSNFFEANFTYEPDCEGDSTLFTLQYSGTYDSLTWDFGDPTTGENNISKAQNPYHVFSSAGEFVVKVVIYSGGSEYPIGKTIAISTPPFVELGNDTSFCALASFLLKAGSGFSSYLWQDGSTDSVFLATEEGKYWVRVENSCGFGSDTINISAGTGLDIDLGNDTSFCYGKSIALSPGTGFYSYYWQDGSADSVLLAGITGFYWVQVTDSAGCTATDSIHIDTFMDIDFSIGPDTSVICEGDYIFLHGPEGYVSYEWQDGSSFLDMIADTAGIYWLEVTDENSCAARDSILLMVSIIPDDFLGNDTVMCKDSYLEIHAPPYFYKYAWNDGSSDSVLIAWETGDYWVYVEDSIGCSGIDTLSLALFEPPHISKSGDSLACPGDSIVLSPGYGFIGYYWSTGSGDSAITVYSDGLFWVETTTFCGVFVDSTDVAFYSNSGFSLGPDTNTCSREAITLSPGPGFASYLWSDGSNDSILVVEEVGQYSVAVFDGICELTDSIKVEKCNMLRVPNVFTPNGDSYNDYFFAVGENVKEFKMTIFNRWGQILKVLNDIDEKWDGSRNGNECPDAVYYWVVRYTEISRDAIPVKKVLKGSVTLIRGK
ncbi:MAG: gliding motility-associated C-terminal domain-containing protein, partial [Chlorobi bacterium]|nr:gliding motility-associated C-terminal domain-containing protein [Chlorobiota bacterium]